VNQRTEARLSLPYHGLVSFRTSLVLDFTRSHKERVFFAYAPSGRVHRLRKKFNKMCVTAQSAQPAGTKMELSLSGHP